MVVDLDANRTTVDGTDVHLTTTELDLLVYLLRRPGRVAMREHLVDAVLPGDESATEALQAHVSRLRRKLGDAGAAIRTIRGAGYRLDAPVDVLG